MKLSRDENGDLQFVHETQQLEATSQPSDPVNYYKTVTDAYVAEQLELAKSQLQSYALGDNHIYVDQLGNGFAGVQSKLKLSRVNYVHLTAGSSYVASSLTITNCAVVIVGDGVASDLSDRPILLAESSLSGSYNNITSQFDLTLLSSLRFEKIDIRVSGLRFEKIDIRVSGFADMSFGWSNQSTLIKVQSTTAGVGVISLYKTALQVADGSGLARTHVGSLLNISWYSGVVTGLGFISGSNSNQGCVIFSFYGVGFADGAKASAGGVLGQNILSNYVGSNLL